MTRAWLAACLLVAFSSADLPNHCLRDQVAGDTGDVWTLHLGTSTGDSSINCSAAGQHQGGFVIETNLTVKLTADDQFTATEVDATGAATGTKGTWTMIYDEGWELRLNGIKYFAWCRYEQRDGSGIVSLCHETANGMFHKDDGTAWGCWYGTRDGQPAENGGGQAPWFPGGEESLLQTMQDQMLYRPETAFVDAVNRRDLGWKARLYPELYDGRTMAQIRAMMGFGRGLTDEADVDSLLDDLQIGTAAAAAVGGGGHHVVPPVPMSVDSFPASWDWRDHNGQNYMNDAYEQGFCGSCWAVAAADVLSARVAIASNNTLRPKISAQEMLVCSNPNYAQACAGGFPFLGYKYAQDYGIGTDDCYSYTGATADCRLAELQAANATRCDANSRIGVSDYYYVGGGYGGGNVVSMMHEIMTNGPISVCITPSGAFQHYKTGCFNEPDSELQDLQLNPFESVTHAVVVLGWGTGTKDGGTKYWICKNSKGTSWGDHGYFYVPLGVNAMHIENMPTAATVTLPSGWDSGGSFHTSSIHTTTPFVGAVGVCDA